MPSLDEDAKLIGINPEKLKRFQKSIEQDEFESITGPIDDREAFIRRKQALVQRWFSYYKKCKSRRNTIIDQYNKIATMRQR